MRYNKRHFLTKYNLVDFSDKDKYKVQRVGHTEFGRACQKSTADKGFIKCMENWEIWKVGDGYKRIK